MGSRFSTASRETRITSWRTEGAMRISYLGISDLDKRTYEWRMNNAPSPAEKERMIRELDLAYRQSIALSPRMWKHSSVT